MKRAIPILLAAAPISLLAFVYTQQPYVWVWLTWFIACLISAWIVNRGIYRIVLVNMGVIFFAIGLFDSYWAWKQAKHVRFGMSQLANASERSKKRLDDDLGYRAAPYAKGRERRPFDSESFVESWYNFDKFGLRVSPADVGGPDLDCILFFGGSNTWGSGVEDEETHPYIVGLKTGPEIRVHNFGIGGYGTHQMLAAIESGYVEDIVECRPKLIIYGAIKNHARRITGRVEWDVHGPRYRIGDDGRRREGRELG